MSSGIQTKGERTVERGKERTGAKSGGTNLSVWIALIIIYTVWGSTYLAIRIGLEGFPPFLMAGARFVVAGALMYVYFRVRGVPNPTRKEWGASAIVGLLLLLGGNGMVTFAEQWVASGVAALAVATVPIFAALFAGLWGRWPSGREWLGLGVGFAGVILLNLEGDMRASPIGALALFFAT